ncbi:MAG: hypothetical protein ACOCQP_03340 [Lentisphaeria bacterium]
MSQARYIITKIRDFVNNEQQDAVTSEHDLAEQFAELCRSFNERVYKVMELIEQGRRSEAVQEVMSSPSLLDLEELLNFPELKKWRNLCIDFGLATAPDLQLEGMEKIKEECAKEEYLEPLLKKFRRLAHEKKTDERIEVLRRIRQLDPENRVWQDNLAPLEKEQLKRLYRQVNEACENDDYERLEQLYEDLRDPRRVVQADDEVVRKIDGKLAEKRAEEAVNEGKEIWQNLKDAKQRDDMASCRELLEQWWRLSRLEEFEPTKEMQASVKEIQKWCEHKEEKEQAEKEGKEELERLELLMRQRSPDVNDIEETWHRLNRLEFEIPEKYKSEVPRKIEELKESVKNRARRRKMTVAAAACAVIAALIVGGVLLWKARRIDNAYERLQALMQRERFSKIEENLTALEEEQSGIYGADKIRDFRRNFERVMSEREERKDEFAEIVSKLESVKNNDYQAADDYITELLEEGRQTALDSEQESRLREWENQWRQWQKRRRKQTRDDFEELTSQLERLVKQYSDNEKTAIEEHRKHLQRADDILARLHELASRLPDDEAEKVAVLDEAVQEWEKDVNRRERKLQLTERERRKLLDNLEEHITDLSGYENRLQDFINRFPEAPGSDELRRALEQLDVFRDVLTLTGTDVPDFPVTEDEGEKFSDLQEELAMGEESIWYRDLDTCANYPGGKEEAVDILEELRLSQLWDMKSISYKKPDDEEWQTIYYPDEFHNRLRNTPDGEEERVYWGNVFVESENRYQPRLEHRMLSAADYDIRAGEQDDDNLIPGARFARKLLGALPSDRYLDDYLVEQMREVVETEDIEEVPKAIILRRLAQATREVSPFDLPVLDKILEHLSSDLNYKVPWVNRSNVEVQKEVQEIREGLAEITPELLERVAASLEYNRWLHTAFLDQNMEIIGVVKQKLSNDYKYPELLAEQIEGAWSVIPARQKRANRLYLAAQRNEDNDPVFTEEGESKAYLGQLLVRWEDMKTREEFLKEGPYAPDDVDIDFPAAWPWAQD